MLCVHQLSSKVLQLSQLWSGQLVHLWRLMCWRKSGVFFYSKCAKQSLQPPQLHSLRANEEVLPSFMDENQGVAWCRSSWTKVMWRTDSTRLDGPPPSHREQASSWLQPLACRLSAVGRWFFTRSQRENLIFHSIFRLHIFSSSGIIIDPRN